MIAGLRPQPCQSAWFGPYPQQRHFSGKKVVPRGGSCSTDPSFSNIVLHHYILLGATCQTLGLWDLQPGLCKANVLPNNITLLKYGLNFVSPPSHSYHRPSDRLHLLLILWTVWTVDIQPPAGTLHLADLKEKKGATLHPTKTTLSLD